MSNGDPFTIALFGVDSNAQRKSENDGERSDTIMLLSINPKKQTTEIVSVPRDTQAEIVGKETTEKINHAYAYGGPTMAVKSLEKLMNVPIDHYATVDMDGLHDMIDVLGGVNVTSNDTFTTKGTNFVKVNQLMWMEILQWPSYVVVKRKVLEEILVVKNDNNLSFKQWLIK